MKTGFIYRNHIFISEVKKRLADKRNYRLKTRLITIEKLPININKLHSKKNLSIISRNSSQDSIFKNFLNFIKEKGYKSAFTKVSTIQDKIKEMSKKKESNKLNLNMDKCIHNILKIYNNINSNNNSKSNYYQINVRKHFNNQKQTPFQINHIKDNFMKKYISLTKRRNSYTKIKDEKSIKSFSINSSGERKKIFGKNNDFRLFHKSKSLNLINQDGRNIFDRRGFLSVKPNCYYNRLNLKKFRLKHRKEEEKFLI